MTTARPLTFSATVCLALVAVALALPSTGVRSALAIQASPDATPSVTTSSARYLPDATALGGGWTRVAAATPEVDAAIFLDAASATYTGPDGARARVTVWTNLPGRAAVQRSWEAIGDLYADTRFEVTGPKDNGREEELAALPLPDGCVDARRIDGLDPLYGLPGALTQCTVEPDVNLLVVVSGSLAGLSGAPASDHLATLAAHSDSS